MKGGVMAQGWPSVQYQELSWPPPGHSLDASWSNRRRRAHRGKYQQAIVPAIADAEVQLSPVLASDVQNFTDDLTRFDAQYQADAPFGAVLLRSESSASSEIE